MSSTWPMRRAKAVSAWRCCAASGEVPSCDWFARRRSRAVRPMSHAASICRKVSSTATRTARAASVSRAASLTSPSSCCSRASSSAAPRPSTVCRPLLTATVAPSMSPAARRRTESRRQRLAASRLSLWASACSRALAIAAAERLLGSLSAAHSISRRSASPSSSRAPSSDASRRVSRSATSASSKRPARARASPRLPRIIASSRGTWISAASSMPSPSRAIDRSSSPRSR